jgi:hypothetical protein
MAVVSDTYKQKEIPNRLGQNLINLWTEEQHNDSKKDNNDVDYVRERDGGRTAIKDAEDAVDHVAVLFTDEVH